MKARQVHDVPSIFIINLTISTQLRGFVCVPPRVPVSIYAHWVFVNSKGRYSISSLGAKDLEPTIIDEVILNWVFNAVGEGTNSGLGSLLLECLSVDYGKKSKLSFTVLNASDDGGSFV
ncbi:hypothetical protein K1719_006558 [Acacia pycnantha]|nr:hypothetical protein K1719_006558 [Acacia pycnantha]